MYLASEACLCLAALCVVQVHCRPSEAQGLETSLQAIRLPLELFASFMGQLERKASSSPVQLAV